MWLAINLSVMFFHGCMKGFCSNSRSWPLPLLLLGNHEMWWRRREWKFSISDSQSWQRCWQTLVFYFTVCILIRRCHGSLTCIVWGRFSLGSKVLRIHNLTSFLFHQRFINDPLKGATFRINFSPNFWCYAFYFYKLSRVKQIMESHRCDCHYHQLALSFAYLCWCLMVSANRQVEVWNALSLLTFCPSFSVGLHWWPQHCC